MTIKKHKSAAQEPVGVVIGIGASAGGLEACRTVLTGLPAEAGLVVFVVIDLPHISESQIAQLLAKDSPLPVEQATHGRRIEPNRVYVIPPRMSFYLEDHTILLATCWEEDCDKPIDRFLRSVAERMRERAIGVILTGSGNDGAFGLRAVKTNGGLTLVQDPESAAFDEMPKYAISQAPVDGCVSLVEMPTFISDYVRRLRLGSQASSVAGSSTHLNTERDEAEQTLQDLRAANAELRRSLATRTWELERVSSNSEKRERQAAALARLSDMIYDNEALERLSEVVVEELHSILEAEMAALYRHRFDLGRLEVLCARGTQADERALQIGASVVTYVRETGRSVSFSDFTSDSRFEAYVLEGEPDLHSGVVTPIPKSKDFLGVLGVYDRADREFTDDEVEFVETVAYIIGTAVVRNEERFLSALNSTVAVTLGVTTGLQEAMERVRKALLKELQAAVCEVWLGEPGAEWESEARVEGLAAAVWESGEPIWITDISLHEEFSPKPQASDPQLKGGLAFPLRSNQERFGVVTCYFTQALFPSRRTVAGLRLAGLSLGEFVRRTRAEAQLQESEKRLLQALKGVPFPLCIVAETGEVWLVSDTFYALTGHEPAEIQTVESFAATVLRNPARTGDILTYLSEEAHRSDIDHHGIVSVWTADEEQMIWDVSIAPLGRSLRGGRAVVAVAHDITEQERVRQELVEGARYKDEFLAMLGHELRNPLASIRGGLQLMMSAESDDQTAEAFGMIDRQSSQMVFLIEGLLDLNRISRGKVSLSPRPLNLAQLTALAVRDRLPLFRDKGVELSFSADSPPIWVRADRTRLQQVIDNLLGNSLKFTDPGGSVSVSLTTEGETAEMRVTDTGEGLSQELAAVIFEPFRQGSQALSRPSGGLGLGLSLVKLIVELHGGNVSVRSEGPDKGSEFLVSMPVCPPPSEAEPEAGSEEPVAPWGVLYIEDNPELGLSLSRILRGGGHQVRHAADGEAALRMIEERIPDIILCDLGLPGRWDGYSLVERLQQNPDLRGVPLVAVTGYGLREDKIRSKAAGFWEHLTKPVELSDIENLLRRFEHPHNDLPRLPREDFCRVLVVDDNKIVAKGTAAMLGRAGFDVQCAYSAPEALRVASEQRPHLALLDLRLSDEGGGFALKEELARLRGLQGCLYFALTGSDSPEDMERTKASGFAAHLGNP